MAKKNICWMSHNDYVSELPDGFSSIATTENCENAAFCDEARKLYAVQYHLEVNHTNEGSKMLKNFLYDI